MVLTLRRVSIRQEMKVMDLILYYYILGRYVIHDQRALPHQRRIPRPDSGKAPLQGHRYITLIPRTMYSCTVHAAVMVSIKWHHSVTF